jgi:hypothetical protein
MRPDHRHKHRSPCVAEPRPTGRHEQTTHHHNHAEFSASERSPRHPTAVPCTWHCRKAPARLSRTCIRSCSRQTVGYSSSTESALEGQGGRGANAHTLRGLPAIQPTGSPAPVQMVHGHVDGCLDGRGRVGLLTKLDPRDDLLDHGHLRAVGQSRAYEHPRHRKMYKGRAAAPSDRWPLARDISGRRRTTPESPLASCVPLLPPPPPSDAPTKASTRGRRGQSAAPVAAATGQHPPDPYLYRRVCAPRAASAHQNRAVVHPRPTSTAWRASGTHLLTIWRLVQDCKDQS